MAQNNADRAESACSTWRLQPDARLQLRYWGDECVLFHGASGDTHRLPQPVGELLEALQSGPGARVDDLSERIDLDARDVERSLRDLQRLGIVACRD